MNKEIIDNNPLLYASKELFKEIYKISKESRSENIDEISKQMSRLMDGFSNTAIQEGVDSKHLHVARYMMCTFCDELIVTLQLQTIVIGEELVSLVDTIKRDMEEINFFNS